MGLIISIGLLNLANLPQVRTRWYLGTLCLNDQGTPIAPPESHTSNASMGGWE